MKCVALWARSGATFARFGFLLILGIDANESAFVLFLVRTGKIISNVILALVSFQTVTIFWNEIKNIFDILSAPSSHKMWSPAKVYRTRSEWICQLFNIPTISKVQPTKWSSDILIFSNWPLSIVRPTPTTIAPPKQILRMSFNLANGFLSTLAYIYCMNNLWHCTVSPPPPPNERCTQNNTIQYNTSCVQHQNNKTNKLTPLVLLYPFYCILFCLLFCLNLDIRLQIVIVVVQTLA